jgi:hypothetical protein
VEGGFFGLDFGAEEVAVGQAVEFVFGGFDGGVVAVEVGEAGVS